jgi:spore coat protein H
VFERIRCVCWLAWLFLPACASEDASEAEKSQRPRRERATEGKDASHGAGSAPDYERIFAMSQVHRIDIEMSAQARTDMLTDMEKLLGAPGSGSMGMGGMGFPQIPPELIAACNGKRAGDGCEASTAAGSCREIGVGLLCLPMDAFGGMGPGAGRGPIDLVGGDPVYVPVTIRYDGRAWNQVGMRYKGNSSLASAWRQGIMKLGFRLHFDRFEDEQPEIADQRFFGFRELTFSSGWNDATLTRDALAGELVRSQGLPTARCAFYQVYVDAGDGPRYWGLYTLIEDPSDALPQEQFESGEGNLYKPDGAGADFTSFSEEGFVKKTNERAADYSDVLRAIDALHASRDDAQAWRTELERVFDVPVFLQTLALSRAIGHWDGYGRMPHNYYLYGDPTHGGRLTWISWDHNLTWQGQSGFGDLSPMMDEVTERWPLIRYLLDDEVYRAQYRSELDQALGGSYAKAEFDARARELHALITPYVVGQGGGDAESAPYTHLRTLDTFRSGVEALIAAADQRREAVRSALAGN